MQHLAKNLVMVNRGLTKHMVSLPQRPRQGTDMHTALMQCAFFMTFSTFLFQTIKNKYATSKHAKISTLSQLNSALVHDLAKAVAKV